MGAAHLRDIMEGLEKNELAGSDSAFSHVLAGYVGAVDTLYAIRDIVTQLKKYNPAVMFGVVLFGISN